MVKINKRPLPAGVKITQPKHYREGIVFKMLVEDCNEKCYICEDSVHTSPNVEHRIARTNDPSLKFDWNNLFLACSHCNGIKGSNYSEIIDPSKVDPEEFIELSVSTDDEIRLFVVAEKIKGDDDVDTTIKLLHDVYNGAKTDIKKFTCFNLKQKLNKDLTKFRQLIEGFQENPNNDSKEAIKSELSDKSLFSAFKRNIVRSNLKLHKEFNQLPHTP